MLGICFDMYAGAPVGSDDGFIGRSVCGLLSLSKSKGVETMSLSCPIPLHDYPHVLLAHGGGGTLMRDLIQKMIASSFENSCLASLHDGAVLPTTSKRLAFTTDSYVVQPLFFPGGDIGQLAICGTVNDLSVMGAKPLYLSTSLIIEEGLEQDVLRKIVLSIKKTAQKASELGFDSFTTVMSLSPWKKEDVLNQMGKMFAHKFKINFLEANFKKKDGFRKSVELSRQHGLYRQNYCGCKYSIR